MASADSASSGAPSAVNNETPQSRYNNIVDGTPFSGVSFSTFNEMTETGLLGLLRDANMPFGKRAELLALKAQLSSHQAAAVAVPQGTGATGGGYDELTNFIRKQGEIQAATLAVLEKLADKDAYDNISESSKARKLKQDDYVTRYGVAKTDLECMITGCSQYNISTSRSKLLPSPLKLTHLLPRCAARAERASLGYDISDIENIRNSVLLCTGIEQAFNQKHISFVPSENPFSPNRYQLLIWCEVARNKPIYEGASQTIGDYDGAPLNLQIGSYTHSPFNRALSHQAFCAFKTYGKELGFELPVDSDISMYQGSYKSKRAEFVRQLAKDIAADADDDDDDP